ncbi:hypothetical protein ABK040_001109 [Willaertia magna]
MSTNQIERKSFGNNIIDLNFNLLKEKTEWLENFDINSIHKSEEKLKDFENSTLKNLISKDNLITIDVTNNIKYIMYGLFKYSHSKEKFRLLLNLFCNLFKYQNDSLNLLFLRNHQQIQEFNFTILFITIYNILYNYTHEKNNFNLNDISSELSELNELISKTKFHSFYDDCFNETSFFGTVKLLNTLSGTVMEYFSEENDLQDIAFRTFISFLNKTINLGLIFIKSKKLDNAANIVLELMKLKDIIKTFSVKLNYNVDQYLNNINLMIKEGVSIGFGIDTFLSISTKEDDFGLVTVEKNKTMDVKFIKQRFLKSFTKKKDTAIYLFDLFGQILRNCPNAIIMDDSLNYFYLSFEQDLGKDSVFKLKQSFIISLLWILHKEYIKESISLNIFVGVTYRIFELLKKENINAMTSDMLPVFQIYKYYTTRITDIIHFERVDLNNEEEMRNLILCLRSIITVDYRLLDGYYTYIWLYILQTKEEFLSKIPLDIFFNDLLVIFVKFAKSSQLFEDLLSALDIIHLRLQRGVISNLAFPIFKFESFHNSARHLVKSIPTTYIIPFSQRLVDMIQKRMDIYESEYLGTLATPLVFPLTVFGFNVIINDSNYMRLRQLAKSSCSSLVKSLLAIDLNDSSLASTLQLYYSMNNLKERSEEFSSDIFITKDNEDEEKREEKEFLINLYDGTGYTLSKFDKDGRSLKELYNNLSYHTKAIISYILFRRILTINQKISILQHNLTISEEKTYVFEMEETKQKEKKLTNSFKEYFRFIENEFISHMYLHGVNSNFNNEEEPKLYDWNGLIELVNNEKRYLSMLWYLISNNFIFLLPYFKEESLEKIVEFLFVQRLNAALVVEKEKITNFSLERVAIDIWNDNLIFEKNNLQQLFETVIIQKLCKDLSNLNEQLTSKKITKKCKRIIKEAKGEKDTKEKLFDLLDYFTKEICKIEDTSALDFELFSSIVTTPSKIEYQSIDTMNWRELVCPFINLLEYFPKDYFSPKFIDICYSLLLAYDILICLQLLKQENQMVDDSQSLLISLLYQIRSTQQLFANHIPKELIHHDIIRYYIKTSVSLKAKFDFEVNNIISKTLEIEETLISNLMVQSQHGFLRKEFLVLLTSILHKKALRKGKKSSTNGLFTLYLQHVNLILRSGCTSVLKRKEREHPSETEKKYFSIDSWAILSSLLFTNTYYGKEGNFYNSFEKQMIRFIKKEDNEISSLSEIYNHFIIIVKIILALHQTKKQKSVPAELLEDKLLVKLYEFLSNHSKKEFSNSSLFTSWKDYSDVIKIFGPYLSIEKKESTYLLKTEKNYNDNIITLPPSGLFINYVEQFIKIFNFTKDEEMQTVFNQFYLLLSPEYRNLLLNIILNKIKNVTKEFSTLREKITTENAHLINNNIIQSYVQIINLLVIVTKQVEEMQEIDNTVYALNILDTLRLFIPILDRVEPPNFYQKDFINIYQYSQIILEKSLDIIHKLCLNYNKYNTVIVSLVTDIFCINLLTKIDLQPSIDSLDISQLMEMKPNEKIIQKLCLITQLLYSKQYAFGNNFILLHNLLNVLNRFIFLRILPFDETFEEKGYYNDILDINVPSIESIKLLGGIYNSLRGTPLVFLHSELITFRNCLFENSCKTSRKLFGLLLENGLKSLFREVTLNNLPNLILTNRNKRLVNDLLQINSMIKDFTESTK